jgi:hypothetical protein
MNDKTNKNAAQGTPEPHNSGAPLGSTLTTLLNSITDTFSALDPTELRPDIFTNEMLEFLTAVRSLVSEEGERAYFGKRVALFLLENLSLASHRDKGYGELPLEHAAVLDEVLRKIQSVRTSLCGAPTVESLAQIEEDAKAFLKNSTDSAGLVKKIILPAH